LRRALRDYDEAAIFTIHGFCQRVLRDFAFESRVDFDAELVPDETALRRTAIHDYWALMAYDADPLGLSW
jgi:exodeoxyribonuclease V beta subunit